MHINPKISKKHILFIIIIVLSFWAILLNYVKQIDRNEILYVFIESEYVNEELLINHLLNSFKDNGIKKVELTVISSDNPYFHQTLLTAGLFEADILILDDNIASYDLDSSFYDLNDYDGISSLMSDRLIKQDEFIYGVQISNNIEKDYTWLNTDNPYIFINELSVHSKENLLAIISFFIDDY